MPGIQKRGAEISAPLLHIALLSQRFLGWRPTRGGNGRPLAAIVNLLGVPIEEHRVVASRMVARVVGYSR